jgi:hypothetical protein
VREEHLDSQMTLAVVRCGVHLAEDHLEMGNPEGAEQAIEMNRRRRARTLAPGSVEQRPSRPEAEPEHAVLEMLILR